MKLGTLIMWRAARVLAKWQAERRGIEQAARWHDRAAELYHGEDRLSLALFHQAAAAELRKL